MDGAGLLLFKGQLIDSSATAAIPSMSGYLSIDSRTHAVPSAKEWAAGAWMFEKKQKQKKHKISSQPKNSIFYLCCMLLEK